MVKLDLARLANSARIERKEGTVRTSNKSKKKNKGELLCTLLIVGMFAIYMPVGIHAAQTFLQKECVKAEEVYLICDVTGQIQVADTDTTLIFVSLPDGSIHQFNMVDIPDAVSEVVIRTEWIDYPETYEIVGLR